MKIELKRVKEMPSMSQETVCFSADVWIDGVKAATVENDGRGGANFWSDREAEKKVAAFVKQHPEFENETFELADQLIGELLLIESERQRALRGLRSCAYFITEKGTVGLTKKLTPAQRNMIATKSEEVLAKLKGSQWLTDPQDIAVRLINGAGHKLHWA